MGAKTATQPDVAGALDVAVKTLRSRAARLDRRLRKNNATDEAKTREEYEAAVDAANVLAAEAARVRADGA